MGGKVRFRTVVQRVVGGAPLSDDQATAVMREWLRARAGEPTEQIAAEAGATTCTIRNWFIRFGIRRTLPASADPGAEWLRDHADLAMADLCAELGCGVTRIRWLFKRYRVVHTGRYKKSADWTSGCISSKGKECVEMAACRRRELTGERLPCERESLDGELELLPLREAV